MHPKVVSTEQRKWWVLGGKVVNATQNSGNTELKSGKYWMKKWWVLYKTVENTEWKSGGYWMKK